MLSAAVKVFRMKRLIIPASLFVLIAFTGCVNARKVITPGTVQSGTAAGVRYGLTKFPSATPAVRIASEVVCSMSNSTNISPTEIVAAIESSNYENLKTPEAIFIVQGVITLYSSAWNSFASDAVAQSEALPYLQAICNGSRDGLAGIPTAAIGSRVSGQRLNWPQMRFK